MSVDTDLTLVQTALRDDAEPGEDARRSARVALLETIDREGASRPSPTPRRRRVWRTALTATAALLAVVAVVSRLWPASTSSAWARQTLQRAAAVALPAASSHTILHLAVTETLSPLAARNGATALTRLSEEGWLQEGAPYRARVIVQVPGTTYIENDTGGVYDATTGQLIVGTQAPSTRPHYTVARGAKPGSYVLTARPPHGAPVTITIDRATLAQMRAGTDELNWAMSWNGHAQALMLFVAPSATNLREMSRQQPSAPTLGFGSDLRGLLRSGHARVVRSTTTDGRPAIEITSVHPQSGPQTTYYVDPQTYAPIELDTYGYDSRRDVTRVRFTAYEVLPLAGHEKLLRFSVPAGAPRDHTPADYWRALAGRRVF